MTAFPPEGPGHAPPVAPTRAPSNTNPLAIVSLVLAFVVPLGGIITGHLALGRIARSGERGRGLAIGGLVAGYAFTALGVIAAVALVLTFVWSGAGGAVAGGSRDDDSPPSSWPAASTPAPTGPVNDPAVPDPSLAQDRTWVGTMTLNGTIELGIELDGAAAPQAVANFVTLSDAGFYDGTGCHRLTTRGIFVLQCGDPDGTGTGGPGYSWGPIENAPADDRYPAGTIAMARIGGDGNSMGSQFFIVTEDTFIPSDSAGGYTVLGRVKSGLDTLATEVVAHGAVDGAPDGPPLVPVSITGISLQ